MVFLKIGDTKLWCHFCGNITFKFIRQLEKFPFNRVLYRCKACNEDMEVNFTTSEAKTEKEGR